MTPVSSESPPLIVSPSTKVPWMSLTNNNVPDGPLVVSLETLAVAPDVAPVISSAIEKFSATDVVNTISEAVTFSFK